MRSPLLTLVGICLSAVDPQLPKPPHPPWGVGVRIAQSVPVPAAVFALVRDELEYQPGETVHGVIADFDEDGKDDYLIQSSPRLCGNGGCPYHLVDGRRISVIGRFNGAPLYVQSVRAGRFPVIETWNRSSATAGTWTTYRFDGSEYRVVAQRELEGGGVDSLFASLATIPIFPLDLDRSMAVQRFEGTVTVNWYRGAAVFQTVRYSYREAQVRSDKLTGPLAGTFEIFDWASGAAYTLVPAERIAIAIDLAAMAATKQRVDSEIAASGRPADQPPPWRATGERVRIADVDCEVIEIGSPPTSELCYADGLGFGLPGLPLRSPLIDRSQPPSSRAGDPFAGRSPLRMRTIRAAGWEPVWEVSRIERGPLPPAIFEIPAGYRIQKPAGR